MTDEQSVTEVGQAIALSAYESFHGQLRLAVPLATALSITLIVGAQSVKLLGHELPLYPATCTAIGVMLFIMCGCYRSALMLARVMRASPSVATIGIRGDSSITNPFSSTKWGEHGRSSKSDYIGAITVHLPLVIILVASILVARLDSTILSDIANRRLNDNEIWYSVFPLLKAALVLVYVATLVRVASASLRINSDWAERIVVGIWSGIILVVPVVVLDVVGEVRYWRALWHAFFG